MLRIACLGMWRTERVGQGSAPVKMKRIQLHETHVSVKPFITFSYMQLTYYLCKSCVRFCFHRIVKNIIRKRKSILLE